MINFTLPFAILPAARHRHKTIVSGEKLLSMSYNPQGNCRERINTQLYANMYMQKNKIKPISKACSAVFIVGLSIPKSWTKKKKQAARDLELLPDASKRNDFDNLAKFVCDCLNGIFFDDDGRIVDGRLIKIYVDMPFTKIILREINNKTFKSEIVFLMEKN